ncbi:MAG: hypothetical protein PHC66_04905 [Candidatus Nanoarchaeia archaeon]|nr:hypothetical protein [Candidatus Nanoarchaeia archaeon]MDD5239827.1 hypothetical protein [Candidatus Nanoarchaeia archaeon]
MNKTLKKAIHWTPRVLSILFILFLSVFALDIFDMSLGIWGTIVGLFMHLIPNFLLIGILVVAWKWERIGGILFIVLGIVFTLFFQTYQNIMSFLLISGPVFLVGILFIVDWYIANKK